MRSDRSKRLLDIIGAGTGLIVLAPLLAVIALAVYVDDRGPIIFRQTRVVVMSTFILLLNDECST